MIEDLHISVPLSEVPEAQVGNYFILSEMPGEFLIIQKPDNTFYFLCSRECDIVRICESFDWYIVSKDAFNDRLSIGIGLADKESIDGEVYRVQDEATLSLWRDILRFTFDSDFVRRFFPYNTRFKGKMQFGLPLQGRTAGGSRRQNLLPLHRPYAFLQGKGGQCRAYPHPGSHP